LANQNLLEYEPAENCRGARAGLGTGKDSPTLEDEAKATSPVDAGEERRGGGVPQRRERRSGRSGWSGWSWGTDLRRKKPARISAAEESRRAGEERRGGGLPQGRRGAARRRTPAARATRGAAEDSRSSGEERGGGVVQIRRGEERRSPAAPGAEVGDGGLGLGVSANQLVVETFAVVTHLIFIYASSRI
jgi:hypothetical protein